MNPLRLAPLGAFLWVIAGSAPAADLTLDADARAHLDLRVEPAPAATDAAEVEGFGVVLTHDAIAQAVAELDTATAAVRQSRAVVARTQQLADGPGADSAEAGELAERQAAADAAALALARRKLTALLGDAAPAVDGDAHPLLEALARGERKLARITFPTGLAGGVPREVALAGLGTARDSARTAAARVWAAPADPQVPGDAIFAVVAGRAIAEGAHVLAWASAPGTHATAGAWIPAAAVIMHDGRYWCFVERKPGTFERVGIDLSRPRRDGYFIAEGLAAGDRVVVRGAGLLLAREVDPGSAAAD